MEVFNDIAKIIEWYSSLKRGFSDIEKLIYTRQKLAGLSYSLADLSAQFKAEHLRYEFSRKLAYAKTYEEISMLRDSDGKKQFTVDVCKSRAEQNEEVHKLASHELEAEISANRARLLLGQVNEVLSALNQQISYLKDEKRNPQNQSH